MSEPSFAVATRSAPVTTNSKESLASSFRTLRKQGSNRIKRLSLIKNGQSTGESSSARRVLKHRSPSSDLSKRSLVEAELLATEKSYIDGLEIVIDVYLKPLREKAIRYELMDEDIEVLFGNIEELLEQNRKFLAEIEQVVEATASERTIPEVLLFLGNDQPFFEVYCKYINNYSAAQALLSGIMREVPKFKKWALRCESKPQCKYRSLSSLIVAPIQRLPRYVMLAKEIYKKSPMNARDYDVARIAIESLEQLTMRINEAKRKAEKTDKLINVLGIDTNDRFLLAEGTMVMRTPSDSAENEYQKLDQVHVFLFADVIVCTDKRGTDYHLLFQATLVDSEIRQEDCTFVIKETRSIPHYPFVYTATFELCALPENLDFWTEYFGIAVDAYWEDDHQGDVLDSADEIYQNMARNSLNTEEWDLICAAGEDCTYEKESCILSAGQQNSHFWMISKGQVRVEIPVDMGSKTPMPIVVATLSRGSYFGEMSLLSANKKITASIIADGASIEDEGEEDNENEVVVIRKVPLSAINALLLTKPGLAMRFYMLMSSKLANQFLKQPLKKAFDEGGASHARRPSLSMSQRLRNADADSQEALETTPEQEIDEENEEQKILCALGVEDPDEKVIETFTCRWGRVSGDMYIGKAFFGFYGSFLLKKVPVVFTRENAASVQRIEKKSSMRLSLRSITKSTVSYPLKVRTIDGQEQTFSFASEAERDQVLVLASNVLGTSLSEESSENSLPTQVESLQQRMLSRSDHITLYPEDWVRLSSATTNEVFKKGDVIVSQSHTRSHYLYQVVRGSCSVSVQGKSVGLVKELDMFGAISFILGVPVTATISAAEDETTVMKFDNEALLKLFKGSPDLGAGFYHFLAASVRDLFVGVETRMKQKISTANITRS